jgi:hypothetical protein
MGLRQGTPDRRAGAGKWAAELAAPRWCLLRDTVADLQDVANGINSLRAYPAGDVAEAMLAVAARVQPAAYAPSTWLTIEEIHNTEG